MTVAIWLAVNYEPLYSGHHGGNEILSLIEGSLIEGLICTKRVHLGLSKVAFIEECPHIRGCLYEGFHCISNKESVLILATVLALLGLDSV